MRLSRSSFQASDSAAQSWTSLTEDGDPRFPERLNAALGRQLTALAWWAHSLRAARNIEIRKSAPAADTKAKEAAR